MILIRDVEFVHISGNRAEVVSAFNKSEHEPGDLFPSYVFNHELVYGKKFVNSDGLEVVLGAANHVQELLGLPFAEIDRLNAKLNDATYELKVVSRNVEMVNRHREQLQGALLKYYEAGFWKRLKYLFTGEL